MVRCGLVIAVVLAGAGGLTAQTNAVSLPPQERTITSSQGVFPLKFGSSTTCVNERHVPQTLFQPTPLRTVCTSVDGIHGRPPLARARPGDVVVFALTRPFDVVRIRAGNAPAIELAGQNVSWRVPTAGTYDVSLFMRFETARERSDATYSVRLRVAANRHSPD